MTVQSEQNGKLLRFGVFELDPASGSLRKNGTRVRLQEQPARVLLHLLRRPGEIVAREELHRTLWTGDTFVDFDHGLNTSVNKIRDALGDSASSPRFIETVPKKGYRFIAPVEEVCVARPSPRSARRLPKWIWASGGLLILAVAVNVWFAREAGTTAPEPAATPLTTLRGAEFIPSLSPDGERVAFSWNGDSGDNRDIYVKQIGSEQLLRITTDPAVDTSPAWSPDGRSIVFARLVSGTQYKLYLVPSFGGNERKIAEIRLPEEVGWWFRAASWLPDGKGMVIADRVGTDGEVYSLYSLFLETGEKRRLTGGSVLGDIDPAVSPDGSAVAFVRRTEPATHSGKLCLQRLTRDRSPLGDPIPLYSGPLDARGPAWTADGREIVFQSGWFKLPFLARMNSNGGDPVRMAFAGEFAGFPAISLSGNRLSFVRNKVDIDIWAVMLGRRGGTQKKRWGGSSTYLDHVPRFSPDGRRVAFISNRGGAQALWISDADGSRAVRLTDFTDREVLNANWSADGRTLSYFAGGELFVSSPEGGPARVVSLPGHSPKSTCLSGDGRWWYFESKKTGRSEIWKAPKEGGETVQVTRRGGSVPHASPDGKYIYYSVDDSNINVWRIPIQGGKGEKVLDSLSTPMNYQATEDGIYFIPAAGPDGRSAIRFFSFVNGRSETLAKLDKPVMWGFAVSPDRRTILYVQADDYKNDLMLVDNFR